MEYYSNNSDIIIPITGISSDQSGQFANDTYSSDIEVSPNDQSQAGNISNPQRVSMRRKVQPSWLKDYVTPPQSKSSSVTPEAQVNSVLLNCPIDPVKYNFQNYTALFPIHCCSVSPSTAVKEPFTYNQGLYDPRWIEAMHK